MENNGDKQVFPIHNFSMPGGTPIIKGGLTKREYFAAMAMQGCISRYPMGALPTYEDLAEISINAAEALLNELNKQNNGK